MKRVLVITYYWPPSGGAGVQRWLKFTKYLPEFGWKPVVYTPENPEAPALDETLFKDISSETVEIKRAIWEPYSWYKKFLGIRKEEKINAGFISEEEKPRLKEKVSVWIRGNFFIPDARKFWVRPSVKYLCKYLENNPVDLVITTGPPHSMHLIGLGLKKHMDIPWIADFRDPWSEIDFYDQLSLTRFADRKHKQQEKKVLRTADRVIAVGEIRARDLAAIAGRKVDAITNGYDETDFVSGEVVPEEKFTIIHVGALNRDRNHEAFWKSLGELARENKDFAENTELKLIGKTDYSVNSYISAFGLEGVVTKIDYLPHDQIAGILQSAHLLYLPINNTPKPNSIIPGKIFEYIASGTPVLGTGPMEGDSASILKQTGKGIMLDFYDTVGIREALLSSFSAYKKPRQASGDTSHQRFSRRNLTADLVRIMDQLADEA